MAMSRDERVDHMGANAPPESVEAAAMPMMDEAELAELRQANAHYAADYERRLATEIVALLPDDREEALRVLAYVDAILNLPVAARVGK
jgi:hypothetical protein